MDYEADGAQFHEMLADTFRYYGKKEPDRRQVRMYFEALVRYSLDDIRLGVSRHMVDPDQGSFMPKAADIVRNVDGNTETQAEQAWTKVDTAIRRVGPHESVVFDDRVIHAVINDMGGWIHLNQVDGDEYPFKHNEFVKRYRHYVLNPPAKWLSRLIGSNEAHNARLNHQVAPPKVIGERKNAILVFRGGKSELEQIVDMNQALEGATNLISQGDK